MSECKRCEALEKHLRQIVSDLRFSHERIAEKAKMAARARDQAHETAMSVELGIDKLFARLGGGGDAEQTRQA